MKPDVKRIAELEAIAKNSIRHRDAIIQSNLCGCYYCEKTFKPEEILDWVDESSEYPDGNTALCPYCGIDSVLPSSMVSIKQPLLGEMRLWFFLN